MSAQEDEQQPTRPLALPAPDEHDLDAKVHTVDSEPIKFDALGPLVVNSDGTLSRIANWENMTAAERQRTQRVLLARNKIRLESQLESKESG